MENLLNQLNSIKPQSECVILIHGLARTSSSMKKAAHFLSQHGYAVKNFNYPSTRKSISQLVSQHFQLFINTSEIRKYHKVHFITHSMGGIILRFYLANHSLENLGCTVMLAPPNQGSEVTDRLGQLALFKLINGPAGNELGTDKDSVPNRLGAVNFELGIIAGNRSINPLLSLLIPGDNDGKVAVARTKIRGMSDFLVVPYTHTFIMQRSYALQQCLFFIQNAKFFKKNIP